MCGAGYARTVVSLLRLLRPLRPFLALTIGVLVLSPIVPAAQDDETARINAWFEKKFEEQLAFSPIQQTFLGRKVRGDRRHVHCRPGPGGPFKSAYLELIAWQKQDRAKTSETTYGVGALPNGRAYYNERLANQTTTTLTAAEIHAIGLSEVARLRAEMLAIKDEVGCTGNLPAVRPTPTIPQPPSTRSRPCCRSTSASSPRPISS